MKQILTLNSQVRGLLKFTELQYMLDTFLEILNLVRFLLIQRLIQILAYYL
jgi:hypothetical protein